ncbi:MAG: hypothetical protein IIA27_08590, partial [Gemmatimonadetes bacterium]|nr:hypothetical protein [Gemmatimonadota bacterium]
LVLWGGIRGAWALIGREDGQAGSGADGLVGRWAVPAARRDGWKGGGGPPGGVLGR